MTLFPVVAHERISILSNKLSTVKKEHNFPKSLSFSISTNKFHYHHNELNQPLHCCTYCLISLWQTSFLVHFFSDWVSEMHWRLVKYEVQSETWQRSSYPWWVSDNGLINTCTPYILHKEQNKWQFLQVTYFAHVFLFYDYIISPLLLCSLLLTNWQPQFNSVRL